MEAVIDIQNNKVTFNNKEVFIIIDKNNQPWFKAKDVANILEYKKVHKAFNHFDEDDKMKLENLRPSNLEGLTYNEKQTIFINESGLYSLILSSKKEEAKKFKKWVTHEVLPSIRKYGEYKLQNKINYLENKIQSITNVTIDMILEKNEIIENKNEIIENKNKIIKNHATPPTNNIYKHNEFILIKKNHMWEYPYYVIRTQKISVKSRFNELREDYPEMEIILRIRNPNSVNLYNLMKERLPIISQGNHFNTSLNEDILIREIINIKVEQIDAFI